MTSLPPLNPDAVLQLAAVTVRRGDKALLDQLDWTVELDERWAILGPNGAGKTTLLQIAATLLYPTSGTAYVLGERLGATNVFDVRPRIGFASAALAQRIPNEETVIDIVVSAGYSVIGRWREAYGRVDVRRAAQMLARMGVADFADRPYGTLSEGERKRVQIARAMMTDPELMLLDEPAAGMDLGGREDLVRRLATMAADPDEPATVLVTHHVEEIPPGFTHVLLLRAGRVVAAGLIDHVLTEANLSATFDTDLELTKHGQRWSARAR